ncbi:V-type proton ATPase subunit S1-like [Halyomorpha halys]|uniref:V-type proton ATPase subunit S1 n=1 Tax=Halyomorpha halys TaxID=286706 RepID=UPI0006D51B6A|nr:V-type proton ATPase subunit S1-like [Halyomorpha halys]
MGSLSYILLNFLVLCYFGKVYCGVPVFIWESSAITEKEDVVPALSQLDVDEFTNHLVKKIHIHKPLIVVFLEETLSVEDFSWKDNLYRGSFPQLKNITSMSAKLEFIPSVDDPMTSLRELIVSHDYIWKKYDGVKLPVESGIILVVKMKDPLNYEDRPQMLRRHDGYIAEIYSQLLAKHSRIIAIFTGKQSSWVEFESNRVKRHAEYLTGVTYIVGDISIHSSSYPVLYDGTKEFTLSGIPDIVFDNRSATGYTRMVLKYTSSVKKVLRFKFPKSEGHWSLSEVEYEDDNGKSFHLLPSKENKLDPIGNKLSSFAISTSPVSFQYFDPNGTRNISLVFNDMKLKAYDDLTTDEGNENHFLLSEASNKDTPTRQYFTEAIWSGLIVTFILGIILAWGITMLLDIRTMDRFDDPKGKTISVSTLE